MLIKITAVGITFDHYFPPDLCALERLAVLADPGTAALTPSCWCVGRLECKLSPGPVTLGAGDKVQGTPSSSPSWWEGWEGGSNTRQRKLALNCRGLAKGRAGIDFPAGVLGLFESSWYLS